tara:strand:- start:342 stop:797 length:456 start_codon:yes stop_codon:yes gene_type:complete
MAHLLTHRFPSEICEKITTNISEINIKERLKKGWSLIHDEIDWRDGHHYCCTYHFCDVQECGCYRRFPGLLLRRVDSGAWIPGRGETRIAEVDPTEPADAPAVDEPDGLLGPAIWVDTNANEIGLLSNMVPVIEAPELFEQALPLFEFTTQ